MVCIFALNYRDVLYFGSGWLISFNFRVLDDRQSMLFSATQTTKVQDLARISLRPGPVHVDVDKEEATSTVATLSQGYVVCPSDRRFLLLFTFLKKNLKKKVIVFFSSCNSVKYHAELLNYIDVPVLDLHVRVL
jgi:ATP-dependent RNA helicase DDX18/HAS1